METLFPFFQRGHHTLGKGHTKCHESQNTFIHKHHTGHVAFRELFPEMYATLHMCTFFKTRLAMTHWPKLWYMLVILNASSSNLVRPGDAVVTNLMHMASILHISDAHLCMIINTGSLETEQHPMGNGVRLVWKEAKVHPQLCSLHEKMLMIENPT